MVYYFSTIVQFVKTLSTKLFQIDDIRADSMILKNACDKKHCFIFLLNMKVLVFIIS